MKQTTSPAQASGYDALGHTLRQAVVLILLMFVGIGVAMAQPAQPSETVQLQIEKASFMGAEANVSFPQWVAQHMVYPESAKEKGIQGRVLVRFIVLEDGRISEVEILRGCNPELDAEAMRVISSAPKWRPGRVNERSVSSTYVFPVIFRLT